MATNLQIIRSGTPALQIGSSAAPQHQFPSHLPRGQSEKRLGVVQRDSVTCVLYYIYTVHFFNTIIYELVNIRLKT